MKAMTEPELIRRARTELDQFRHLTEQAFEGFDLIHEAPYIVTLAPKDADHQSIKDKCSGKDYPLVITGSIHGDEYAGMVVVNKLLSLIQNRAVSPKHKITLGIGNTEAALINRRFVERDLNRCFGVDDTSTLEFKRAKEFEKIFAGTRWLLDIHQTKMPCESPFFIFPYMKSSFEFARAIDPQLAIVTHWGKPFSSLGMCTDTYVNSKGGIGVSVELGQKGFDHYQVSYGLELALNTLTHVHQQLGFASASDSPRASNLQLAPVFHINEAFEYPQDQIMLLKPNIKNFQMIEKGENIGSIGEQPYYAETGGRILFPAYLDKEQIEGKTPLPDQGGKILTEISENELPTE